MVNVTFAVPEELHGIMRKHSEIKWGEIARRAMWEHAKKIEMMDKLVAHSKLTDKDVEEVGRKIKEGLRKRHFS